MTNNAKPDAQWECAVRWLLIQTPHMVKLPTFVAQLIICPCFPPESACIGQETIRVKRRRPKKYRNHESVHTAHRGPSTRLNEARPTGACFGRRTPPGIPRRSTNQPRRKSVSQTPTRSRAHPSPTACFAAAKSVPCVAFQRLLGRTYWTACCTPRHRPRLVEFGPTSATIARKS